MGLSRDGRGPSRPGRGCKAGVVVRVLLILLAVVAGLWSAAWFAAARVVERAAETWFAETAAAGALAGYDHLSVGGWPWRLELRVERPRLLDPGTGAGWQGDLLRGGVAVWAPLRPELAPEGAQVLLVDGVEWVLEAEGLRGGARLALGPAPVEGVELSLRAAVLRGPGGALVRLEEGVLRVAPGAGVPWASVELVGLEVAGLDWPDDVAPRPAGPVGRLAGRVEVEPLWALPWPPARIGLRDLALDWGDTLLRGAGSLDVAPEGWPEGRITFQAEAWEPLVALAVALGAVTPEVAPKWLQVFGAIEEADGADGVLEVPLIFQRGRMSFGPLPLGPAPRVAPPRAGC